ncbi:Zinc finger protein 165, partial [Buceros rhinoceros silvestris]
FTCTECGRSFNRSSHLIWHRCTYTREKPYSCTICGRSFSVSSSCWRHECTHTRNQP